MALGKTWRLHKVYLCQSSYFASMFGGSWRETNQDFVNIEIIDPKINIDGMLLGYKNRDKTDGDYLLLEVFHFFFSKCKSEFHFTFCC